MDTHKSRKTYSFQNNNKFDRIKNKKELRLRLIKLTNNYFKPRCEHYINSVRSFNLKLMEHSGGQKAIEKEIKKNKIFRFGKRKDYLHHLTDLSPYNIDVEPFLKNLKDKFTKEEIDIIKKNKDYYLTNEILKENISMFNVPPLYQILNKEEADEKKVSKVFHDLNYFNKKRRNSVLNINNLINKKKSGFDNIKDIIEAKHKKVYRYGNNILEYHNEKNNYTNNLEKEIRDGIRQINDDDKIKDKVKNLTLDIENESIKEIKNFYKNKRELDLKNKMNFFENIEKKKKRLPLITINNISKNKKFNSLNNELSKIKTEGNIKRKKPDLTKKIIDYEQKIIRDVNRRIKSIYENLNKQNKSNK